MRTKNSIINIGVSCTSYVFIMIGSFITRSLFSSILGLEIIGIEGTYQNIVSALAIVELGLGVGIVYKLYKPIADENWDKVSVILCFLKKAYLLIALTVFSLGLIISFFVGAPIKEDFSKTWLSFIFLLYVLDVISSYLFSHKRAMFIADQKNYINNIIHTVIQVAMFVTQICILVFSKSFELYLICKIIFRLAENIIISYYFEKRYPFINTKTSEKMPSIEKKDLFNNIKAMLLHKIAGFSLTSTSSLIIMYFVNLRESGMYSNYMLIVTALISVSNEFFNGIVASFGNLLNTESKEKVYSNFNVLYFINFLIYSFFTVSFFNMVTPFVSIWTGENTTFPILISISIAGYLYMYGIRQSLLMVKVGAGIYNPDKYFAVLEAIVTLVLSLILVRKMGVAGVMLGNMISMFLIPFWTQPYLVYKIVFNQKLKDYYFKYFIYALLTIVYTFLVYSICSIHGKNGILGLILNAIACLLVPNILNIIIFYRTDEFKRILDAAKNFGNKLKNNFRKEGIN